MNRRGFLRFLPLVPTLPALVAKIASAPAVTRIAYAESARKLLDGSVLHARQGYMMYVKGAGAQRLVVRSQRPVESVTWVTKNGETVDGSTRWLKTFNAGHPVRYYAGHPSR